jgi:hypothetical protein
MERMDRKEVTARGIGVALAAVLLACAVVPAVAQQKEQRIVARLKSVSGNVLVSREAGLAAGAEAQRLADGTRVITTANSEAVIEFDDGCEVRLKENERYEVDSGRPCALRLAGGLGGAPVAAVGAPWMGYVLPVVLPVLLLDNDTQQTIPVSPN